ncbi:class II aldolase/adducin family protein [bacterium]|nr:class II aldolase/adducin family protein [bacterium]
MTEQGYIKFQCRWIKAKPLSMQPLKEMNYWRKKLYALGLVGADENRIGFGNLSIRFKQTYQFIITGTRTGHLKKLFAQHYVKVIAYNWEENRLTCRGPIKASSESLSHGAIYQSDPGVQAVIHIHHLKLWKKLVHSLPTTSPKAEYGTPALAAEIMKLLARQTVREKKIFAMAGHEGGIISFGSNISEAGEVILKRLDEKHGNRIL